MSITHSNLEDIFHPDLCCRSDVRQKAGHRLPPDTHTGLALFRENLFIIAVSVVLFRLLRDSPPDVNLTRQLQRFEV